MHPRLHRIAQLATALALTGLVAGGCNSADDKTTVNVFAAASLTDAFRAIADDFRKTHPGIKVNLNFAGSQTLRTQIEHGANPQVFASANRRHMAALENRKLISPPVTFAHNEMVIVVPPGNPAGITNLATLANAKRIVLAGASVPAGAYAQRVLNKATETLGAKFPQRVLKHVVSREQHVRQTLQKVVLGEADAAMVYATDAVSAGDKVRIIRIPSQFNINAAYPIASVGGGTALGDKFIEFVRSPAGRKLLQKHGFRPSSMTRVQTAMNLK